MFRPLSLGGALRLAALLALFTGAACTTEFLVEGGDCRQDVDCETGEVCQQLTDVDGELVRSDSGVVAGVCLRKCDEDSDCVAARNETCLIQTGASTGVCARACVTDADCGDGRTCAFGQCRPTGAVPDLSLPPDGAPSDAAIDGSPVDGSPVDLGVDLGADGAVPDAEADMSVEPVDGSAIDQGAADDLGPDMAPDMAPEMVPDMAPAR